MSTIVFCEDDPSIRKLIGVATRSLPHDVHIASDGLEGLSLIEELAPAVVFTDVAMPVMTGIELVERLRESADRRATPVVFMTASVQRQELASYSRLTALAPLPKPFNVSQLRAKIAAVLEEVGNGR